MDGRIQLPVIKYLQKRFNAEYVDSITEAGVSRILAEGKNTASIQSILKKLKISIEKHNSVGIAVVAHHDCAGNPALKNVKIIHIKKAIQLIRQQCKNMEIIGLWVDENWKAQEVI
jgi:copper homeostasis protein CutC